MVQETAACGGVTRGSPPPLAYLRRPFPWREPSHPFLQQRTAHSQTLFRSPAASGALHALVADHVVLGRIILPGAGYLEAFRAAASTDAAILQGVFFVQPLAMEATGLHIECAVQDGRCEMRSTFGDAPAGAVVHCSATLGSAATEWQLIEHTSAQCRSRGHASPICELYDGFDAVGLQYGPGYRTLAHAWSGVKGARAQLQGRVPRTSKRMVHPADLDDALCVRALVGSRLEDSRGTQLPFALDEAQLQCTVGRLWAVRCHADPPYSLAYPVL